MDYSQICVWFLSFNIGTCNLTIAVLFNDTEKRKKYNLVVVVHVVAKIDSFLCKEPRILVPGTYAFSLNENN